MWRSGCGRGWDSTDERAGACAGDGEPAGGHELLAAVGEIDGDGGEGGTPGVSRGGEPDAGGESEREAERGVPA